MRSATVNTELLTYLLGYKSNFRAGARLQKIKKIVRRDKWRGLSEVLMAEAGSRYLIEIKLFA